MGLYNHFNLFLEIFSLFFSSNDFATSDNIYLLLFNPHPIGVNIAPKNINLKYFFIYLIGSITTNIGENIYNICIASIKYNNTLFI